MRGGEGGREGGEAGGEGLEEEGGGGGREGGREGGEKEVINLKISGEGRWREESFWGS